MAYVTELHRVQQGFVYAAETDLTIVVCPRQGCSITHAIPTRLHDDALRAGHSKISWYCPNGHPATFRGRSAEDELREKLEREQRRAGRFAAERDQALASERAQRAAATRARNERDKERKRVGNGVCPCCNRTFTNLQRHMASKHPEHAHPPVHDDDTTA